MGVKNSSHSPLVTQNSRTVPLPKLHNRVKFSIYNRDIVFPSVNF